MCECVYEGCVWGGVVWKGVFLGGYKWEGYVFMCWRKIVGRCVCGRFGGNVRVWEGVNVGVWVGV